MRTLIHAAFLTTRTHRIAAVLMLLALSAHAGVLRLVRVAIGSLQLGNLSKGGFRSLTTAEIDSFDFTEDQGSRNSRKKRMGEAGGETSSKGS